MFQAALFDEQLRLLKVLSFQGTEREVVPDLSAVFREAVRIEADAILIAHNHPSGNAQPSRADQQLTREFSQACEQLEITLLDHIVFANGENYSFRAHGVFDPGFLDRSILQGGKRRASPER
ncbi:JAB domain-containing protein [Sphingomonas swuensis]|uniref:JAB domain-containing protein n=1 Tax=Sphingomonas swuensis TaxID=977800 RepID=UPI003CD09DCF